MPISGASRIFPTNPDLADILGDTDFDADNIDFCWIPNSQLSRSPDLQITDFQTPALDKLSDPNLTPLPTRTRIKYVARRLRSPCCDLE